MVPAVTAPVAGSAQEAPQTGASPEVLDEVKQLLRENKVDEALDVLDSKDINYAHTDISGSPDEDSDDGSGSNSTSGGDFSTQDALYDPGENPDDRAEINLTVLPLDEEKHHYAVLQYDMLTSWCGYNGNEDDCEYNGPPISDSAAPVDGVGITFNHNAFYVDPGTSYASMPAAEDLKERDEGITCKFDDVAAMEDDSRSNGTIQCELRELNDYDTPAVPVYGHYIHTWTPFGLPTGWGVSLGIPGPGSLSISYNGDAEDWEARGSVEYDGVNEY